MDPNELRQRAELAAVLICPNRTLARQFVATIPETRAFQLIADVDSYPSVRQLDSRLRQLRPDVVLLDLSADTEKAVELISAVAAIRPAIHVIGLHQHNDAAVIIRSLRAGSTEFLCAPFDVESQSTVVSRIVRLRQSDDQSTLSRGQIYSFVGAKAEDVRISVETSGSPQVVVYAASARAGGGVFSLASSASNFGSCLYPLTRRKFLSASHRLALTQRSR